MPIWLTMRRDTWGDFFVALLSWVCVNHDEQGSFWFRTINYFKYCGADLSVEV